MSGKRWQNLIHRKCPCCDSKLDWNKQYFKCPDQENCKFFIRGTKIVEILSDPEHIIQEFMTEHERKILDESIKNLAKIL